MGTINKKVSETGRSHGFAEFTRLFRSMVDPYRPEQHYMRGPGPKWRAKHVAARPRPRPCTASPASRADPTTSSKSGFDDRRRPHCGPGRFRVC